MTVEALDLGDALRTNAAAAGLDLDSDAPVVTGSAPPARSESDNPFQRMLDNNGQLPEKADPSPAPAAEQDTDSVPAEEVPTGSLTRLKERFGVDLSSKYKSDDDLLQSHVALTRKLAERDELANLGRLAATNPQALIDHYRERGLIPEPQPAKQAEPQPTAAASGGPEWNDDWNRYIERGRLAEDTPPQVAKEINDYYRSKAIAKSPEYQAMQRKLAEIEERMTKQGAATDPTQATQAHLAEFEQRQMAKELIDRNSHWLFTTGPDQQRKLTPDGFVWVQALNEAHQAGLPVQAALKMADQEVALRKYATATPKPTPNKQATQRRPEPARPSVQQGTEIGDGIRPGEDIASAAKRILTQLNFTPESHW